MLRFRDIYLVLKIQTLELDFSSSGDSEIYSCARIVNIFFKRMELCREVYKEMSVSVFSSPFKNSSFTVKGICKRVFYFLAAGTKKVDKHLFKSVHMLEYNKNQNIQVLVNPQQT